MKKTKAVISNKVLTQEQITQLQANEREELERRIEREKNPEIAAYYQMEKRMNPIT